MHKYYILYGNMANNTGNNKFVSGKNLSDALTLMKEYVDDSINYSVSGHSHRLSDIVGTENANILMALINEYKNTHH